MRWVALGAALLVLGAQELSLVERGIAAYAEERYAEALQAFHQAAQEAGDDSPALAVLEYDQALAALGLGELELAVAAAQSAKRREPAELGARADFVLALTHYRRALEAEALASLPGAPAQAFDPALEAIEAARDAWIAAALAAPDWPEARRNVERALIKRAQLMEARRVAESNRRVRQPDATPEPDPEAQPPTESTSSNAPPPAPLELSPGELAELLSALERSGESRDEERARRRTRSMDVEKDW